MALHLRTVTDSDMENPGQMAGRLHDSLSDSVFDLDDFLDLPILGSYNAY